MISSPYAAKPWAALLSAAQRTPVTPAETLVHAFRASVARAPERPALAYFDGRLTYRETDRLSDSVAGHLAAEGLRRGDRVAIMLQNTPHFVPALLGAWKADATKERLAAYKYPREVEILAELPKTASGKILRRELRSPR
ncbi:hypothetical protein A6A29_23795 [Streptomyces sp. TSRI0281]|nr:hypothetical protein A6A29_23795 [Streptomyces sp. TSRI0281]